jgi:hypothetical protein
MGPDFSGPSMPAAFRGAAALLFDIVDQENRKPPRPPCGVFRWRAANTGISGLSRGRKSPEKPGNAGESPGFSKRGFAWPGRAASGAATPCLRLLTNVDVC